MMAPRSDPREIQLNSIPLYLMSDHADDDDDDGNCNKCLCRKFLCTRIKSKS